MARLIYIAKAGLFVFAGAITAVAAPEPVLKSGNCPAGYRNSGKYCVPVSPAVGQAIKKDGNCPSGYRSSGRYCVARDSRKVAIEKEGNCPSAYRSSGNYCVKQ